MTKYRYRPNVAIIVLDIRGLILTCERRDIAGAWQLPQGGIDAGETPLQAMYRELDEEIGTSDVEVIGKLPKVIPYLWPKEFWRDGYHGQKQHYFLVRLASGANISLENKGRKREFRNYEFLTADAFLSRISSFKKDAYTQAIKQVKKLFPGTITER